MKPSFLILALALLALPAFATPTALTAVQIAETAAAIADNSADTGNGNSIANPEGDIVLIVRNTHATNSSTVTLTANNTTYYVPGWGPMTKASQAVVLAAGDVKVLGPLTKGAWNDGNGRIQLTYSGTGTVKVSPVRVPKQ